MISVPCKKPVSYIVNANQSRNVGIYSIAPCFHYVLHVLNILFESAKLHPLSFPEQTYIPPLRTRQYMQPSKLLVRPTQNTLSFVTIHKILLKGRRPCCFFRIRLSIRNCLHVDDLWTSCSNQFRKSPSYLYFAHQMTDSNTFPLLSRSLRNSHAHPLRLVVLVYRRCALRSRV